MTEPSLSMTEEREDGWETERIQVWLSLPIGELNMNQPVVALDTIEEAREYIDKWSPALPIMAAMARAMKAGEK